MSPAELAIEWPKETHTDHLDVPGEPEHERY
jgi:hypothetical protein